MGMHNPPHPGEFIRDICGPLRSQRSEGCEQSRGFTFHSEPFA